MHDDRPDPLAALRLLLGGTAAIAAGALVVVLVRTGTIEWRLVALITVCTGALGFASDLARGVAGAVRVMFQGGAGLTLREEATFLERRLGAAPPPEKEVLWGVRLAEIYRRHFADPGRADALLDRLLAKYPTSRELRHARGLLAGSGTEQGA